MENGVQIFENVEFGKVRTVIMNDEPWFVGKDVAEILSYADTDQAIRKHVDEEDKLTRHFNGSGQNREMTIINESGLYSLIILSKLPAAKKFKRWVTSEVLPSIRKTGSYSVSPQLPNFSSPAEAARAWADEYEKRCIAQNEVKYLTNKIEEQKPKVNYYDVVLKSKDALLVSVIAQDYGMIAKAFNSLLYENGIQHKLDNTLVLYAKYVGNGYTKSETYSYTKPNGENGTKVHTKWTQKGRLFLYEFLKNVGVLPEIEK